MKTPSDVTPRAGSRCIPMITGRKDHKAEDDEHDGARVDGQIADHDI